MIHKININKGKMTFQNQQRFNKSLESLEGEFELVIRKARKDKTLSQLKYLYGVVLKYASQEMGLDIQETKQYFKATLGFYKVYEIEGKNYSELKSISRFSTKELSEYIEGIKNSMIANYQCIIPNANEIDLDIYENQME
jgi:hypothetical protein